MTRYYVYGNQRIFTRSFDDSYFRDALRGSNKSRALLTSGMLEKYVRAEFVVFIIFLRFLFNKKLIQAFGNAFAQGIHDGVTLGDHKGYESLGVDVIDIDWDTKLCICIGFRQKPKRHDGSFDGSNKTVARLFDTTLQERIGHKLEDTLACMISDRSVTGVARGLDLDGDRL